MNPTRSSWISRISLQSAPVFGALPGPTRPRPAHHLPRAVASRAAVLAQLVATALCLLLTACSGLTVTRINAAQKKPNNVWVFFTVEKGDEPVGGLTADSFEIYEDGELVSKFESKQTIQNPDVAAVMYTMLLLDFSGSITEAEQADAVVDAAKLFADRVGTSQKVGVYIFDGSEKIQSVVPFTEAQGSVEGGLEGLRKYKPKDPSTNLHGAVMEGIRELKKSLDKDRKPLKFGTLVVFSDGTDRAARYTRGQMKEELDKKEYENYELFAIGVGAEIEKANLDDIGRDGTELATDQAKVKEAFEKVAARIERHMKRFYLLSYCTPARKGEHEVRIEVHSKDPEGSGANEYSFSADGFGPPPDCDPNTPPAFTLKAEAPATDSGSGNGAGAKASVEVKATAK